MVIASISTAKAPAAVGSYSQGICAGDFVFVSGQIPLCVNGTFVSGGMAERTTQCLANIRQVLIEAGLAMEDVVKTTVFMTDLGQFSAMNDAYGKMFKTPYPARSTVQVHALPKGADIEIEAVAVRR